MSSISPLLAVTTLAPADAVETQHDVDGACMREMERALSELENEMADLQHRHRDIFSYANAWAERHDALLRTTPTELRSLLEQRLHRIGVRWGVVTGVRMTAQFPAIKRPL